MIRIHSNYNVLMHGLLNTDVNSESSLVAHSSGSMTCMVTYKSMNIRLYLSTFFNPWELVLRAGKRIGGLVFEQTTRIDLRSRLGLEGIYHWHFSGKISHLNPCFFFIVFSFPSARKKILLTGVTDTYFGFAFFFFVVFS